MHRCPFAFALLPSNWSQFSPFQVTPVIFAEDSLAISPWKSAICETDKLIAMQAHVAHGIAPFPELIMTAANISLKKKYRLTRKALAKAGLDMTGSMDVLYRDWRRRRD
jgi:hypothetical protein